MTLQVAVLGMEMCSQKKSCEVEFVFCMKKACNRRHRHRHHHTVTIITIVRVGRNIGKLNLAIFCFINDELVVEL